MRVFWLSILVLAMLAGCGPAAASDPTATPLPTDAPTTAPTNPPDPTATVEPTDLPTETPEPTDEPSATPTGEEATEEATAEVTEAATAESTEEPATTEEPSGEEDFAPTSTQVWQLDSNPYSVTSSPACAEGYAYNFYGLVAVRPSSGNLTWQRQDSTSTLARVSVNNYYGQIPGFLPGYDLQIAVSFTSYTTLIVSHTLVSQANPACTHTFDYRAAYAWDG